MPEVPALETLEALGASLTGHFLLTTGRHSDRFFLLARLTERPSYLQSWAKYLARAIASYRPQVIIGPAVGGITPAWAVAAQFPDVRAMFCEKNPDGTMGLKRGFRIEPGARVVVIEDAVTTGGSVQKVIDVVERARGVVQAVAALVDRTGGHAPWPVPFIAGIRVAVADWDPAACPLCQQGLPFTQPKQ